MHKKQKTKTMDIILAVIAVVLIAFTVEMIKVFKTVGAVPDTLVTCVFGALTGELGIMGWIKTAKEKYQDNQRQK